MPGIADLLYLGQPDPARQLAAMLSGQQPQGAPPQGAAPPGTPSPPPDGAAAPAQNAAPGAPPPPGSPPQPTAYASSPDMSASYQQLANPPNLMSLYLQLQQRQAASDQINRGFALIAANHSMPGMREAIMQSVGGGPDAGQTVSNLMSLYQGQQQMAAQQQMLAQAPAIAAKLGMDEGVVRAEIMAGRGPDLVRSLEPTEQHKNIQWQHDQFIRNGGSETEWRTNVLPTVMMASLPGMTPDYMSYMKEAQNWPQTHPGQPVPDFVQWKNIVLQEQATTKEKQDMVTTAQGQQQQLLGPLTSMESKVNDLQKAYDAHKLDVLFQAPGLIQYIAEHPNLSTVNAWTSAALSAVGLPSITQEQINYAKNIIELTGGKDQAIMHSLGPTSGRNIAPQFETIGSYLGPVGDLSRGKDDWGNALNDLKEQLLRGQATVYGQANTMPQGDPGHNRDILKRMPAQFIAGGALNLRGPPTPVPADEMAEAVEHLKQHPEDATDLFHVLQAENHDTRDLEQRFRQGQIK